MKSFDYKAHLAMFLRDAEEQLKFWHVQQQKYKSDLTDKWVTYYSNKVKDLKDRMTSLMLEEWVNS